MTRNLSTRFAIVPISRAMRLAKLFAIVLSILMCPQCVAGILRSTEYVDADATGTNSPSITLYDQPGKMLAVSDDGGAGAKGSGLANVELLNGAVGLAAHGCAQYDSYANGHASIDAGIGYEILCDSEPIGTPTDVVVGYSVRSRIHASGPDELNPPAHWGAAAYVSLRVGGGTTSRTTDITSGNMTLVGDSSNPTVDQRIGVFTENAAQSPVTLHLQVGDVFYVDIVAQVSASADAFQSIEMAGGDVQLSIAWGLSADGDCMILPYPASAGDGPPPPASSGNSDRSFALLPPRPPELAPEPSSVGLVLLATLISVAYGRRWR